MFYGSFAALQQLRLGNVMHPVGSVYKFKMLGKIVYRSTCHAKKADHWDEYDFCCMSNGL